MSHPIIREILDNIAEEIKKPVEKCDRTKLEEVEKYIELLYSDRLEILIIIQFLNSFIKIANGNIPSREMIPPFLAYALSKNDIKLYREAKKEYSDLYKILHDSPSKIYIEALDRVGKYLAKKLNILNEEDRL